MAVPSNWFVYVRQALELLYYLSGIVIAIAAIRGLSQLTITREIARVNAKREAYKLAADECRNFAAVVVPLQGTFDAHMQGKNLQSLLNPHFVIENGEIANHNFNLALLNSEYPIMGYPLVSFLNAIEAFAIFFASGVATEEIGYRETGTSFCSYVERLMPAIFMMRSINVRYESTIKLYEIWHGRQEREKISAQMRELESAAKRLPNERIKPIGT
jgi:hypothetical protein